MASADIKMCDICYGLNETKYAEHLCTECEERLCSECFQSHSIMRATKNHEVISLSNYQKLPLFLQDITQYCRDHQERYQIYCLQHQSMCCPTCIVTSHEQCTRIKTVADTIKTAKSSVLLDNIESTLNNIQENVMMMITDRSQNLEAVQKDRINCHQTIDQIRAKINAQLDFLKSKLDQELDCAEKKIRLQIENLLKDLDALRKDTEELKNGLSAVKDNASNLQAFIGSKTLEDKVNNKEEEIKSLFGNGNLDEITITCKINQEINDILIIEKFGTVSVESKPSLMAFKCPKEQQAQMMTIGQTQCGKSVDNIKFKLKSRNDLPAGKLDIDVSGCAISPNGKIIIADFGNCRLLILTENGKLVKEIAGIRAFDVVSIDDKIVALSSFLSVLVMNIDTGKTEKKFDVKHKPFGIHFHRGNLLWCGENKGISGINLSDGTTSDIVELEALGSWCYLEVFNENIFLANCDNNAIECFQYKDGSKIWELRTESLRQPRCISSDNASNIYMASYGSNSIDVISSDGKNSKQQLGEGD